MVDEGKFQLYAKVKPALTAGDYTFAVSQDVEISAPPGGSAGSPSVEELDVHVRVRAPQYVLPPDQVLSTFPPAGHEGAFGARLPQVVLRRRTLPWERHVHDSDPSDAPEGHAEHRDDPWLALVVFTGNEAELRLNQKVGDCVTGGITLDPPADSELGNCLAIRRSTVHRIFPTQQEVHLLAHGREVNINDTELMMGDDDGQLAVVISNRLPLPARDQSGKEVPTEYTACLVNLCGQWDALLPTAPPPAATTLVPQKFPSTFVTFAEIDHLAMQLDTEVAHVSSDVVVKTTATKAYDGAGGWGLAGEKKIDQDILQGYLEVTDKHPAVSDKVKYDPELKFPVLLHWKFTTHGSSTFESLMKGLDSGLLGTAGNLPHRQAPFEVVETGHLGLVHRLRSGDQVRSWYRGPLVPHPTVDDPAARLPLAHTADQLRTVVPDRREDISLASAFEIGRLLGLSRPSMISALLRWRQVGFQVAHRRAMMAVHGYDGLLEKLDIEIDVDINLGDRLGAMVAEHLVEQPDILVGNPVPLVTPGRPVLEVESVTDVLATGFAIDAEVFDGAPAMVVERLNALDMSLPRVEEMSSTDLRDTLAAQLDTTFARVAIQALAPQIREGAIDLGSRVQLPADLTHQLENVVTVDDGSLRRRLDVDVDVASLPEGADVLDVLMRDLPRDLPTGLLRDLPMDLEKR